MIKKFALSMLFIMIIILSIVFVRWEKLDYNIESYSYACVKDDSDVWLKYDFVLSEAVVQDLIKNPDNYYVVTFDGTLYNGHIYKIYNWYILENRPIDWLNDYWVDSSPIEATFPLEPFSGIYTKARILVKCKKTEISQICEEIIAEELLLGKGQTIISLSMEYRENQKNDQSGGGKGK